MILLIVIDESHVSVPQIRAMYGGDRARENQPGGIWFPDGICI